MSCQGSAVQLSEIASLLDTSFQTKDYTKSFPLVFCAPRVDRFFTKQQGDKLVAFLAIVPLAFVNERHRLLRAACVSSVSCLPEARGKGYASALLNDAQDYAVQFEFDFLLLFSQEKRVYEKFGFVSAGNDDLALLPRSGENKSFEELMSKLKAEARSFEVVTTLGALSLERRAAIWRFICKNAARGEADLGFSNFEKLMSLPTTQLCILSSAEKIEALCFIGKGIDYENVAHAFYFENDAGLCELVLNLQKTFDAKRLIISFGAARSKTNVAQLFKATHQSTLMIKGLRIETRELKDEFDAQRLYVPSLLSN